MPTLVKVLLGFLFSFSAHFALGSEWAQTQNRGTLKGVTLRSCGSTDRCTEIFAENGETSFLSSILAFGPGTFRHGNNDDSAIGPCRILDGYQDQVTRTIVVRFQHRCQLGKGISKEALVDQTTGDLIYFNN